MADAGVNSGNFRGGERNPDARSAHENSHVGVSPQDRFRAQLGEVRKIDAGGRAGPCVDDVPSEALRGRSDRVFQFESGMIAGDDDSFLHAILRFSRGVIRRTIFSAVGFIIPEAAVFGAKARRAFGL